MKDSYKSPRQGPISVMSRPFIRFLEIEAAGGVVLLICTAIALMLANSPFAEAYASFWNAPVSVAFGKYELTHTLVEWINDGLMTIFFFVVGLEIKRELICGELKTLKAAALPISAAIGGMLVPASVYTMVVHGGAGSQGWGIPMATDIAFVVGFLALLGKRVPHGLKIFILSLAIVDDIGAVIAIALFYSSGISFVALSLGIAGFIVTYSLNRMGVRRIPVYVFVGFFIWLAFLFSGVHPTVAGVLLGLLTPASAWLGDAALSEVIADWQARRRASDSSSTSSTVGDVNGIIFCAKETVSPLERLEVALHPWVTFFIMPLFALANAGVPLMSEAFLSQISFAVASGLVLGKVIGIVLFSWLAVKVVGSRLPSGTNWKIIIGSGFLAGIGFTMSLFIASLALDGSYLIQGKAGTLLGSVVSSIVGLLFLHLSLPKRVRQQP